jgi:DNA-binding PadR family transcriptional regulator
MTTLHPDTPQVPDPSNQWQFSPLSSLELHILIALINHERTAYILKQFIAQDTDELMVVSQAGIRRALERCAAKGWVEATNPKPRATREGNPYRLTSFGRQQLTLELDRLSGVINLAHQRLAPEETPIWFTNL